mmetsp:Transcript_16041/g.35253  ORF Transcript_16041/g.35253 Transcript_16041/m.35253 type:complete len:256 (-) Transcript_16041:216-983(-)|eukprot:CAMPEP_0168734266 /NCGR_PEP_ID=MMETSP0724-20121128/8722_1 /TAXON_ID=265536 /ORGANISM="Amphiprora sp., Strain CCMP467" /LENGTH=255 /DNA_ID=CAMNT_0008781359 /DNA_START=133 /DNA_END=900 /DNA_ORIENTATION=+
MTVDDQMRDEALLETALLQSYLEFMEQSANTADDSDRAESRREQAKLESTPPATPEMLRLLPILQLRDEDLEVNPECCICLEEYETGEKVVRIPHCNHIFHRECCRDWLSRKCTCPYCRTDTDEQMKKAADAGEEHQGHEPKLAFTMAALRRMTVPQLRKLINKEAGVFFEKEVTKKEDMIKVFINSGRVRILPPGSPSTSITLHSSESSSELNAKEAAEKKRDASIKIRSSQRLRTKIRRLFGPRSGTTASASD